MIHHQLPLFYYESGILKEILNHLNIYVYYNMELKSITMFENSQYNYGISDVWGYTDEAGNEYAILGYKEGTKILDVSTDSENPIEIMNIPGPTDNDYYYHRDYKTYDDYLDIHPPFISFFGRVHPTFFYSFYFGSLTFYIFVFLR